MRRRDSAKLIEKLPSIDGWRVVILPRDLQLAASNNPAIRTERLPDMRWRISIHEDEIDNLAGMAVDTIRQIRDGVGRVSDRRVVILRAFLTDDEWRLAEEIVAGTDAQMAPIEQALKAARP